MVLFSVKFKGGGGPLRRPTDELTMFKRPFPVCLMVNFLIVLKRQNYTKNLCHGKSDRYAETDERNYEKFCFSAMFLVPCGNIVNVTNV